MPALDPEKLVRLPSLPTVAIEVLKALADTEIAASEIVDLILADPALSGKILQVANSARYGNSRPIGDIHRASMLLGKRAICSLALGFALAEASMTRGPHAALFKSFWLTSFTRGLAARTLAERFGGFPPEEAFTLGLVSQVGQLILLKYADDEYAQCREESSRLGTPIEVVEAQQLGVTSHDLTRLTLARWKMPLRFVEAVEDHFSFPPDTTDTQSAPDMAAYLRVAGALADFMDGQPSAAQLIRLHEAIALFSSSADDDAEWLLVRVTKLLRQNAALFSVDLSEAGSPTELLNAATEQLARIALAETTPGAPLASADELLQENDELRQRLAEVTRQSNVDPLTAVFNRRCFQHRLEDQVRRARDTCFPVALLMVDIDHFKQVNDRYGHTIGDRVLQLVADTMEQTIRGGDLVARFGGEEFVVLLEAGSLDKLKGAGERLRHAVSKISIPVSEEWIGVTVSVGGCVGTPSEEDTQFASRLVAEADRNLYSAKRGGRNCVVTSSLASVPSGPQSLRSTRLSVTTHAPRR